MKLFIADDEIDVREGIRYLLDWEKLGFFICGEGKNGQNTLEQILKSHPDVVLLDIRMPKLSGLEVVKQAKERGFRGRFIILSGYSDFSYAQEAIRFGVTCYLTKPIDEDELEKAVLEARDSIQKEQETRKKLVQYRDRARESILQDVLCGKANYDLLDYHDIMLESSVYQAVIYTNYNQESFQTTWDFAGSLAEDFAQIGAVVSEQLGEGSKLQIFLVVVPDVLEDSIHNALLCGGAYGIHGHLKLNSEELQYFIQVAFLFQGAYNGCIVWKWNIHAAVGVCDYGLYLNHNISQKVF